MGTQTTERVTGTRQRVYSANYGGELIVAQCSWLAECQAEHGEAAIIAGEVEVSSFYATADGRSIHPGWHRGDEAEAIYAEHHFAGECVWHGWIDGESRKVVQSG